MSDFPLKPTKCPVCRAEAELLNGKYVLCPRCAFQANVLAYSAPVPDGNVHTMPVGGPRVHFESSRCWCHPVRDVVVWERQPSGKQHYIHTEEN